MADLPIDLPRDGLGAQLTRILDVEGKIPRALEALGPLEGREVVLLDGAEGVRARQLAAFAARVTVVDRASSLAALHGSLADLEAAGTVRLADGAPDAFGLPTASADVVVGCWSRFRGEEASAEMAEAERVLRPGGRLLAVHDYGRDDVSRLRSDDLPEYRLWSRRDGWFLRSGFKIRVIHCYWTFDALEGAAGFLEAAFGETGRTVASALKRPRLTYNVAIYHRGYGELEPS